MDTLSSRHEWKQIERRCRQQKIEQYNTYNWMRVHGKLPELNNKLTHNLKLLFNELDSDKTGLVSIEELYNPLLSLGLVQNKKEVEQLVQYINAKRGGVIQFDEFLKIFNNSPKNERKKSQKLDLLVNTIARSIRAFQKSDLPFNIAVCNRRRKLMMQAYVSDNPREREKGIKIINVFASETKSAASPPKIQRIYDRRVAEFSSVPNTERHSNRLQKTFLDTYSSYQPPDITEVKTTSNKSRIKRFGLEKILDRTKPL
jgi:EF-hand domain pair